MSKKVKQMSYLSMIVFVIGSTIGAGIFFKNKNIAAFAHGELGPILATWGVAIIGILAMAMALIEVSSAQKTDKGTLEWTKLFAPKWFHKSSNNYMKWIFIPITLFTMPLYVVSTFQDAGWEIGHGMVALAVAFAIFIWFMVINLISFRFSEISQWVFTAVQTIPLIVLPIVAYSTAGHFDPYDDGTIATIAQKQVSAPHGIGGVAPWIALIAGVAAISFAYDGFYVIASMKEKTNGKAKMGAGMVLGVAVVSALYLFLTFAFNVGSNSGSHYGIKLPWSEDTNKRFMSAMNACIAIGIIGIINGYCMGSPRQFRSMAESGEAKEVSFVQRLLFRNRVIKGDKKQLEKAGWTYLMLMSTLFFIVFGLVGVFGYSLNDYVDDYGSVGTLYTLADALVNFTSLLMFIIIATSILGAIINRRTNKVEVKRSKVFLPAAWISVIIFYAAGAYIIGSSLLDMFNVTGDLSHDEIISAVIKFVIFIAVLGISIIPALIKDEFKSRVFNVIKSPFNRARA